MRTFILFILLLNVLTLQSEEIKPVQTLPPLKTKEIPLPPELKEEEMVEHEEHFTRDLLNMLSTLGLIVALLYAIAYFMKRVLNSRVKQLNTSSLIKVVEQRNLSPKTVVYLLEVHDKTIVVTESANGVTLLTTLRQLSEPTSAENSTDNPPLQ